MKQDDITSQDLSTLCEYIINLYSKDKTAVDGTLFAHLATRLLAAEIQPGGPYRDTKGGVMPTLNAHIGRLFILMGKPLPNIDTYIESLQLSDLTPTDRLAIKRYFTTRQKVTLPTHTSPQTLKPYQLAKATLERIEEPARTQAIHFLERVKLADTTREIGLISHFTAHALHASMPTKTLDKLGEANIHGWIAYMIYDHIIDHDASTQLLPVANICMRLSLDQYRHILPAEHTLQKTINQYFNQVDTANAWELAYCRYDISNTKTIRIQSLPDYKQNEILAQRSAIHILGPIIVASLTPVLSRHPVKREQFITSLRHYLIARQLSDDIHDWREDLQAGQISAVVSRLLDNYEAQQDTSYPLDKLTIALQDDFLKQISQDVSTDIVTHAQSAKRGLTEAGCIAPSELIDLITRLENMASASIKQQSRFLEFQHEYQATSL